MDGLNLVNLTWKKCLGIPERTKMQHYFPLKSKICDIKMYANLTNTLRSCDASAVMEDMLYGHVHNTFSLEVEWREIFVLNKTILRKRIWGHSVSHSIIICLHSLQFFSSQQDSTDTETICEIYIYILTRKPSSSYRYQKYDGSGKKTVHILHSTK